MRQKLDVLLARMRDHAGRLAPPQTWTDGAGAAVQRLRGRVPVPRALERFTAADHTIIAWSELLIWFFRALSIFQLAKGLVHWALLLSGSGEAGLIASSVVEEQSINIYFAVVDTVAGVGLWMTSSWGAVLWLLAAVSQLAISFSFPEIFGPLWILVVFEVTTIGVYVFLTWKVAQTNEDA